MGIGQLTIQVHTGEDALPVVRAKVVILRPDGKQLYETETDGNGNTGLFSLSAPDAALTLDPTYTRPAYSVCNVDISKAGFVTEHVHGVEIVDTQVTILPVHLKPLETAPIYETEHTTIIPPIALLLPAEHRKVGPPGDPIAFPVSGTVSNPNGNPDGTPNGNPDGEPPLNPAPIANPDTSPSGPFREVIIPDYITVHLGQPSNAAARNVRVKFTEYIKNVTSSEIYSTWPESSLIANIHAITTFALNRIYTEWYPSRGFPFDITNSTSYDQFYRDGGPIFENISKLVDEIFNIYARRIGFRNPFFTQFCNGSTVTCPGMSQWGSVTLANQGYSPLEILRYYYPNDLELTASDNITGITESFPGIPLRLGDQGEPVRRMQNFLNRIRVNFPLIPRISNPNGVFGADTQDAVRTFQRAFNLTADGVIGRATWNKISFIHVGVIRLGELDSEGERATIGTRPPNVTLSQGSRGEHVVQLQFILDAIAPYYPEVPIVIKDGVFDNVTKNAVIAFQRAFGLNPDGIVGPVTWNKLYAVYQGIHASAPVPPVENILPPGAPAYPGSPLQQGSSGAEVRLMQTYLNTVRIVYPSIPYVVVNGRFDELTRRAVIAFQQEFVLTPDGIIGPVTWRKIVEQYMLVTGNAAVSLEYPGTPLRVGSRGNNVRLMQNFLVNLHNRYPSLPAITVDGIFGPATEAAVIAFQRIANLTPDGIIGPATWEAIVAL